MSRSNTDSPDHAMGTVLVFEEGAFKREAPNFLTMQPGSAVEILKFFAQMKEMDLKKVSIRLAVQSPDALKDLPFCHKLLGI